MPPTEATPFALQQQFRSYVYPRWAMLALAQASPLPPARLPTRSIPVCPVANRHAMTTRGKVGFLLPALF